MKSADVKGSGVFFALSTGQPVTRQMFVTFLKQKLARIFPNINPNQWSGISLRKGGATSAMRAGVQSEVIQKLGGWATDAYKSYLDHTALDVSNAQQRMATAITMPIC